MIRISMDASCRQIKGIEGKTAIRPSRARQEMAGKLCDLNQRSQDIREETQGEVEGDVIRIYTQEQKVLNI